VRVPVGEGGVGLQRDVGGAGVAEGALDDVGGLGKTLVHIAVGLVDTAEDVGGLAGVVVDEGFFRVEGVLDAEDLRDRLILHPDQAAGPPRRLGVHRRHAGDGLPDVADLADGERGLVLTDRDRAELLRQFFTEHHPADAGQREGGADVDAADPGVGAGRAQELGVEHAGQRHVGHEAGAPGDALGAVDLGAGAAEQSIGREVAHAVSRARASRASRAASRILV